MRCAPLPLVLPFMVLLAACSDSADKSADSPGVDSAPVVESAPLDDTSPCDGQRGTVYPDADGDGFGIEEGAVEGCIPAVEGFAEEAGDCDDQNNQVHPAMNESCLTAEDDNCDGMINAYPKDMESSALVGCVNYYLDEDGDGVGRYGDYICACEAEDLYTSSETGDCDDDDPTVWLEGKGCLMLDEDVWTARFDGFQEYQRLGFHLEASEFLASDVTGDGVQDLLAGNFKTYTADGDAVGALFIVQGPFSNAISLDDSSVIRLEGGVEKGVQNLGFIVLAADLDGDGVEEVVAGGSDGAPGIWIIDGARWMTEGIDATTTILQAPLTESSVFGRTGAISSDIDGDGLPELILGDDGDAQAGASAGAVYIIENPPHGRYDVNTIYTAKLMGEAKNDWAGGCVADAGDTDGDGLGDIVVGASHKDDYRGAAYLVRGPLEGLLSLSSASAMLVGESYGGHSGCGLTGGGDANGDGLDDLLIGAYTNDGERGAAYLVLGGEALTGTASLGDAAEATFVGHGERLASWTGTDVAFVSTTESVHALAIGSGSADMFEPSGGAVTYVVNPEPGVHTIGSVGVTLNGTESPASIGWSLAATPDLDGDGWGELLIGAPGAAPGGVLSAGSIFLVSGGLLNGLQ